MSTARGPRILGRRLLSGRILRGREARYEVSGGPRKEVAKKVQKKCALAESKLRPVRVVLSLAHAPMGTGRSLPDARWRRCDSGVRVLGSRRAVRLRLRGRQGLA